MLMREQYILQQPKVVREPEIQTSRGKEWQHGVWTLKLLAVWMSVSTFSSGRNVYAIDIEHVEFCLFAMQRTHTNPNLSKQNDTLEYYLVLNR